MFQILSKISIMEKFNFTGFCSKLQLHVLTFYSSLAPLGKCRYLSPQLLTASTTPPTLQRERWGAGRRGNGNTT